MFNSLFGRISGKQPGQLFLETAGVEWDIAMPDSALSALPDAGSQARVFTYLHHRDDQMRLFGFSSPEERALFLDLLKVDGVGPRAALRIMSGGPVEQLIERLDEGDVDSLARFPGIGKKTAQKIVLALRGKLRVQAGSTPRGHEEIAAALTEMGFDRRQASEAVASVAADLQKRGPQQPTEEEILKEAILRLSGTER